MSVGFQWMFDMAGGCCSAPRCRARLVARPFSVELFRVFSLAFVTPVCFAAWWLEFQYCISWSELEVVAVLQAP
jgi:hypothetical protein